MFKMLAKKNNLLLLSDIIQIAEASAWEHVDFASFNGAEGCWDKVGDEDVVVEDLGIIDEDGEL